MNDKNLNDIAMKIMEGKQLVELGEYYPSVKEGIKKTIKAWETILEGVKALWSVYEEHQDLNDVQPKDTSDVVPMSLDEWYAAIVKHIEKWEKLQKNY